MDKNVGASFGLSVLIVVFFAVILYHPETPPPPVAAVAAPPVEPQAAPPARSAPHEAKPPSRVPPPQVTKIEIVPEPEPAPTHAGFTTVRAGETLADVARRVYGRDEATQTLWLANRDRLDSADAPVSAGSILRTP